MLRHSMMHDAVQAKKMHIHMCLHKAALEDPTACEDQYLALMARYTYIWAGHFVKPPVIDAINRALPGRSQGNMQCTCGCAYVH